MYITLTVASICFLGGSLSGMAGFGALILMVPALIMILGMNITVPLGILCGFASQMANTYAFRAHIKKDALFHMLLGSLPGVWVGVTVLHRVPEEYLRALLGLLLVAYVLWSLLGSGAKPTRPPATIWACAAGFFSGAFGGAFGINGPPVVVYLTRTGWEPNVIRAFIGCFSGLVFVFLGIALYAKGVMVREVWEMAAVAVPSCLAGNLCGRRLAARLKAAHYMRLVFVMLMIMGLSLCWPAFRAHVL